MSNITNTCLYHECTNITNIPSSTNMYHASTCATTCTITSALTMHQTCIINTCTITCVNLHAHQPCTSTVNTYIIPCANHVHQPSIPISYHVPTMHINHAQNLHRYANITKMCLKHYANIKCPTCTSIMCQTKNQAMPEKVLYQHQQDMHPIMYLKPCASTIYHITHDMSQSCHTP
jgi:hypothetical protein